jgi:hypothetical protein
MLQTYNNALVLTGVFIITTTTASSSNVLLGWNCGYSFTSSVNFYTNLNRTKLIFCDTKMMYGILYAMTPEMFSAKDRGTGGGITSAMSSIFGILSPIVALHADLRVSC